MEKLKGPGNEDKLNEFKRRKAQRDKKYYEGLKANTSKHGVIKNQKANYLKSYRQRAKIINLKQEPTSQSFLPNVTQDTNENSHLNNSSFKSSSAASRALNKADSSLPKDEMQRKEIIKKLALRYGVVLDGKKPKIKRPRREFDEIEKKAVDFYKSDLVAHSNSGINDFVFIINEGVKEKIQTMTLRMKLEDVHSLFLKTYPELRSVSLSKFKEYRPDYVLPHTQAKQVTCLCKKNSKSSN